jgi:hypothetical protein
MKTTKLTLDDIRIDGGTQSRVSLSDATVAEYAEIADELPPLVVFYDGSHHWLADGFHRWHAFKKAGRTEAACDLRKGTQTEARMYAVSKPANGAHGLRRTNPDKRRCVEMALGMVPEWSDRRIAEHVGVGRDLVDRIRREQVAESATCEPPATAARRGADGKTYPPSRRARRRAGPSRFPPFPVRAATRPPRWTRHLPRGSSRPPRARTTR